MLNVARKTWDSTYSCRLPGSKSFSPGGPLGLNFWLWWEFHHFRSRLPVLSLWERSAVWPPVEKFNETFQLDPGGCVSHFWTVLAVSCGKIENLTKSWLPPETPPKCLPLTVQGENSDFNSLPWYFTSFITQSGPPGATHFWPWQLVPVVAVSRFLCNIQYGFTKVSEISR